MDNIFYFSSPPRSYSPPRRSPYHHNSVSSGKKRRRPGAMDGFRPHACMALLDEPTFCPSEMSVLLSEYSWNFHGLPADASLPTTELTEDEDEDVSGGVALHMHERRDGHVTSDVSGHLDAQPNSERSLPDALLNANNEPGPIVQSERDHAEPRTFGRAIHPRLQPADSTVLGTAHPRPYTQELWAEEDSRRLRFALDGVDTDDSPRFLEPTALNDPEETLAEPMEPEIMSDLPPPPSRTVATSASIGSHSPERHRRPEILDFNASNDQIMIADPGYTDVDEWLPVDDPRREYDVADFLDQWRLRSITAKDVIAHTVGIQPSLRLHKPPEHSSRHDTASSDLDWQGIHWKLMGPKRQDALVARIQMHPSRPARMINNGWPANLVANSPCAYRYRGFTPQHRAQTSHYQLRNVLAASSRADIFYAKGNKVMRTSLACPIVKDTVIDSSIATNLPADFRVTCLTASADSSTASFMVAGGFNGEYALLTCGAQEVAIHEGHVTHAYNGLVTHIHAVTGRCSGTPQAIFCSNDRHVRLLDIETQRMTSEFLYPSAINCAATAPDRRLRVIVGDCRDAYITNAERGEILMTLTGHTDHGFACAWSTDGVHVATGAQDGKTLVWDARNWSQPLQALPSVMSCPRSLHFTDDGALVIAESDDIVSIYDPQTFDKRQDLRFFGSIAGVALLNGGQEIAVANTDKSVGGLLTFGRLPGPIYSKTPGTRVPRTSGLRRGVPTTSRSHIVSELMV